MDAAMDAGVGFVAGASVAVIHMAILGAAIFVLGAETARWLAGAQLAAYPERAFLAEGVAFFVPLAVLLGAAKGGAGVAVAVVAPLAVGAFLVVAFVTELLGVGRLKALESFFGKVTSPTFGAITTLIGERVARLEAGPTA